jgi:hypothetical protein
MLAVIVGLAVVLPQLVSSAPTRVKEPREMPWKSEAVSGFALTISPSGKVEGCRLQATSFYPELDDKGCPALEAARFAPATDFHGVPAYGVVDVQVKWPQGEAAVGAAYPDVELSLARMPAGVTGRPIADLVLSVNRTGGIDSCVVAASTGSAALDAAACSSGVKAANVGPVLTPVGAPAPSVRSLRVRFVVYPHYGNTKPVDIPNLYPLRAQLLRITGFGVARCQADSDGVLKGCTVAEEGPKDVGFGLAAAKLVMMTHLRVTPDQKGEVFVPVGFDISPCAKWPESWISDCGVNIGHAPAGGWGINPPDLRDGLVRR